MKPEKLIEELESIITNHGYKIRKERGSFRSNNCMIDGSAYLIINKLHPVENQISILAKLIFDKQLDQLFIKPIVRKELDKIWKNSMYANQEVLDFDKE
ncbi:hypothetical protein EP331_08745 [bacterium]|nr:MAG: hypothetical protein EP331_08745 [bacterium]